MTTTTRRTLAPGDAEALAAGLALALAVGVAMFEPERYGHGLDLSDPPLAGSHWLPRRRAAPELPAPAMVPKEPTAAVPTPAPEPPPDPARWGSDPWGRKPDAPAPAPEAAPTDPWRREKAERLGGSR